MDADYLAAVERGDMETAQRMVDAAAKAAGLDVVRVYHGTKKEFTTFNPAYRDPSKLSYFSYDKEFARRYATGSGGHRTPEPAVVERIKSVKELSKKFFDEQYYSLLAQYGSREKTPDDEVFALLDKARDYERSLLDGMTVFDAQSEMGVRVLEIYLDTGRVFNPRQQWREFLPEVLKYLKASSWESLRPDMQQHVINGNYMIWEAPNVVDAVLEKYDSILLQESTVEQKLDTIAVRDPRRIKSADPVTRDEQGNVIPLSQRFDVSKPSFLYQQDLDPEDQLERDDLQKLAQILYHGTPWIWEPEPGYPFGRPRLDKLGTGEGVGAYGWGFYTTAVISVAEHYRSQEYRTLDRLKFDGKPSRELLTDVTVDDIALAADSENAYLWSQNGADALASNLNRADTLWKWLFDVAPKILDGTASEEHKRLFYVRLRIRPYHYDHAGLSRYLFAEGFEKLGPSEQGISVARFNQTEKALAQWLIALRDTASAQGTLNNSGEFDSAIHAKSANKALVSQASLHARKRRAALWLVGNHRSLGVKLGYDYMDKLGGVPVDQTPLWLKEDWKQFGNQFYIKPGSLYTFEVPDFPFIDNFVPINDQPVLKAKLIDAFGEELFNSITNNGANSFDDSRLKFQLSLKGSKHQFFTKANARRIFSMAGEPFTVSDSLEGFFLAEDMAKAGLDYRSYAPEGIGEHERAKLFLLKIASNLRFDDAAIELMVRAVFDNKSPRLGTYEQYLHKDFKTFLQAIPDIEQLLVKLPQKTVRSLLSYVHSDLNNFFDEVPGLSSSALFKTGSASKVFSTINLALGQVAKFLGAESDVEPGVGKLGFDPDPEGLSKFLLSLGFSGMRYEAGMLSGQGRVGSGDANWLIWDQEILNKMAVVSRNEELMADFRKVYESIQNGTRRGEFDPATGVIMLLKDADSSTLTHELAHWMLESMGKMAMDPNADQSLRDDMGALLSWFGIKDGADGRPALDIWINSPLSDRREGHERFAISFEDWLLKGIAPTKGMSRLFDQMRYMMIKAYGDVYNPLNEAYKRRFGKDLPAMTPEVKEVYTRLIDADQQMDEAEAAADMLPRFTTKEQWIKNGGDDAGWAEYQQALTDARADAKADITQQSQKAMAYLVRSEAAYLRDIQKQYDAEYEKTSVEVEKELRGKTEYKLLDFLAKGVVMDEDGKPIESTRREVHRTNVQRFIRKGGLAPTEVANQFGYQNATQMLSILRDTKPLAEAVANETAARMQKKDGFIDVKNAPMKVVAPLVAKALHNKARMKFVAIEIGALIKSQQPVRILNAAAAQGATNKLREMRLGEVLPNKSKQTARRFRSLTMMHLAKAESEQAAKAAEQELLYTHLHEQQLDFQDFLKKAQERMKSWSRPDKDIVRTRDIDRVMPALAQTSCCRI